MGGGLGGHSWFDNLNLFMGLSAFDAELRYQMSRVLLEHARWLYRNEFSQKGKPASEALVQQLESGARITDPILLRKDHQLFLAHQT